MTMTDTQQPGSETANGGASSSSTGGGEPRPTSLARFAPVAVFAVLAALLGVALTNDPRKMPSQLIDRTLPRFSLPALDGGAKGLVAEDIGGRGEVVLLNVFASWCPGCRLEHPTLMRIAHEGAVPLYAINWKDKPGDGAKWLKAHANPYLKVGDDANGRVGIDMGVTGVPETFVLDRTGRIRYRHAGPVTDDVWRETFVPLLASLRSAK